MRMTERRLRSIIRSVIKENVEATIDRLPDIIEDDKLRDLISGVYSIFELGYEDSDKKGYLAHLDTNHIDKVNGVVSDDDSGIDVSSMMGLYMIEEKAFKILGFSDGDIKKLREYKPSVASEYEIPSMLEKPPGVHVSVDDRDPEKRLINFNLNK